MENQSENPKTFAETKQPLLVNSAGLEITAELLLNDENILKELAAYYEWDTFEKEIGEYELANAFAHYLIELHPTGIDEDTVRNFDRYYVGFFDSPADFAEDFMEGDLSSTPIVIQNSIDWHNVANELEGSGNYKFIPDKFEDTAVHVFFTV